MKSKEKNKYYLVVSENNGYTHGAFPFTEEGLLNAKRYIKKSSKKNDDVLVIKERG
jgi:hypothetical protein